MHTNMGTQPKAIKYGSRTFDCKILDRVPEDIKIDKIADSSVILHGLESSINQRAGRRSMTLYWTQTKGDIARVNVTPIAEHRNGSLRTETVDLNRPLKTV